MIFEGKEVKVLLAHAGAGKTSSLINIIADELKTRRPEEIAFVTFTRKGAEEGLRRTCDKFRLSPDELPYFKTLHSLTFSALNLKLGNVFGRIHQRAFNKKYGYNVNRCEVDTGKVSPTKDSRYLDFYDLERSGALTSRQLAEADIELRYYRQLVHDYEEYKASNYLVDFFDCLIKYVQAGVSLPCRVVICDECFSPETKVRMADGTSKEIKDIKVGDYVQGTKGATRVTAVHSGTDTMYDVYDNTYAKDWKLFTCNSKHLIQEEPYHTFYDCGITTSWKHCIDLCNSQKGCYVYNIQKGCSPLQLKCRIVERGTGKYVGITVGSPDHLFLLENGCVVHNCQDISMLQWQVISHAFKNAEKVYIAGDSEQSIYKYSGARPDCLIKLSKAYPVQFLSESYRIPRKVWELSKGIIKMISEKSEMPFNFHEGNPEGSITRVNDIGRVVNLIEPARLSNKNTTDWYILARNNCYLDDVCMELEQRVIPYWTAEGFFMAGNIISRLADYEGFRLTGYKNEAKRKQFMDKFGITDFSKPFTDTNLFTEEKKWVYNSYLEAYGLDRLKEMCKWNPQVLVSTVHHVKGGEADNVVMLLDTTRKTKANFFNDIDEELRILYVGVTRTKKNLFLVDSHNGEGYDEVINTIIDENSLDI